MTEQWNPTAGAAPPAGDHNEAVPPPGVETPADAPTATPQTPSEPEVQFKKVLVCGAKNVGKSSILGAAIGAAFSGTYTPTKTKEIFRDLDRRIEFYDTPGLDASILQGNITIAQFMEMDEIKEILGTFEEQPARVTGGVEEEKARVARLLPGMSHPKFDAYVIVYSTSFHSRKLAHAIHEAIAEQYGEAQIFFVENKGDIPATPEDLELRKLMQDETNTDSSFQPDAEYFGLLFEDRPTPYHHVPTQSLLTKKVPCRMNTSKWMVIAPTFENVHALLNAIQTPKDPWHIKGKTYEGSDRSCTWRKTNEVINCFPS